MLPNSLDYVDKQIIELTDIYFMEVELTTTLRKDIIIQKDY